MTTPARMRLLAGLLAGAPEHASAHDVDPDALRAAAVEQGVDALVWRQLEQAAGPLDGLRAALYPGVRAAVSREIFVQAELQAVFAALGSAGIPVLVTKGTALAYAFYAEPWLRPRADTDLLVRRADVEAAAELLEARGYSRSAAISTGEHVSHQAAFERRDPSGVRHVLDLHWRIANPQVVAGALAFDALRAGSCGIPALGGRTPSAGDSLALACVHRLAHHQGHERLIWLYDMVMLARTMDAAAWHAFADLARRQGIAAICLDGLSAARSYLRLPVPPDVEERLAAAAPGEASRIYVDGPVTRRDVLLSDLAHLGTWRARVRLLREHVFPPPAFMRQRYGTHVRWPLPALYLHRFLTGAARWHRS